jgi:hypothetical protein
MLPKSLARPAPRLPPVGRCPPPAELKPLSFSLQPGQAVLVVCDLLAGQDTACGFGAAVPGAALYFRRWLGASGSWRGYAVFESADAMRAARGSCGLVTEELLSGQFLYHVT